MYAGDALPFGRVVFAGVLMDNRAAFPSKAPVTPIALVRFYLYWHLSPLPSWHIPATHRATRSIDRH